VRDWVLLSTKDLKYQIIERQLEKLMEQFVGSYQVKGIILITSTECNRTEWAGVGWNYSRIEGIDNKVGTTLASARALCLDLLSRVWLCISGGLNCCQELQRGVV